MKRCLVLPVLAVLLTSAGAAPHKIVRNTPALDFSYQWSAEAAAIPVLDRRLYNEGKAALAEAQKDARADQALAREQKRDFHQHDYAASWETAGQTPRLLSLEGSFGAFTGGAHPNSYYKALLWDRQLNRRVGVDALFARNDDFAKLTRPAYCKALDAERKKRRERETLDLPDFNQCPKYSELAIAPTDRNKNGRFDTIDFVASPYVAGPYVEGEYEIEVPVSTRLIAAMKPEYRASFEPHRQ